MRRITSLTLAGLMAVGFLIGAASSALTQQQPVVAYGVPAASASQAAVTVVDTNGLEVGPYENIGGLDSALVKISGNKIALEVGKTGFTSTGVFFQYASGNCSGAPLLLSAPSSLYISYPTTSNGGVAGGILYYPTPGTSKKGVAINSEKTLDTTGKITACYPLPTTSSTVSTVSTFTLKALGFTEPFKISF
ncbi:MAG: hypothetical protein ACLQU2_31845 [Candidatus Binataceae bacterium]